MTTATSLLTAGATLLIPCPPLGVLLVVLGCIALVNGL